MKVLWDINVQFDNVIKTKIHDIILIDKKECEGIIINIAVTSDVKVGENKREKRKSTSP